MNACTRTPDASSTGRDAEHRGRSARAARRDRRQPAAADARDRDIARASTPARERRCGRSSRIGRRRGSSGSPSQLRADLERANAFDAPGSRMRRAPASRSCAAPTPRRSRASRCRTATSPVGGWRNTPYVVIQNVGAYLDVPRFLDSDHRIENAADAEAYLARLQSYAKQLDGELGRIQAARATGPRAAGVPARQGAGADRRSRRRARARAARSSSRSSGGRRTFPGNWAERARTIAAQEIAPALERQMAELQAQRAVATDDAGHVGAAARRGVSTAGRSRRRRRPRMSPDEVHEMGRSELRAAAGADGRDPEGHRLHAGHRRRAHEGAREGSALQVRRRRHGPRRDHGVHPESSRPGSARRCRARSTRVVNPNMEVKRLPPEEEPGAPARLRRRRIDRRQDPRPLLDQPADDRPAQQVQPRRPDVPRSDPRPHLAGRVHAPDAADPAAAGVQRLLGRLGALCRAARRRARRVRQRSASARLGYLQSIAFRACRLVVDTGIHAKRWTREQGVRFFVDVNGSNPLEVASEVDRYCSWPGQACGYKVGHSEINRQREKRARRRSGRAIDLKAFNDTVVLGGNVPLDVLAKNVDEYIRTALPAGSKNPAATEECGWVATAPGQSEQRLTPIAAIEVHDLVPRRHKVASRTSPSSRRRRRPRRAREARSAYRRPGRRGWRSIWVALLAAAPFVCVRGGVGRRLPLRAHVEQVHEEVVGQRPGRLVKTLHTPGRHSRPVLAARPRARSSRARSASAGKPARSADARPAPRVPRR